MSKVRVLVIEDSLTVRKRLVEIIESDPGLELVGEAGDGKLGLEICQADRPDVVSMDMMLPVMSGLAATEYIMAHCPTPILVVSASTNRGELFKIYEALAAGAVDVLEKPTAIGGDDTWERRYRAMLKLVAKIRVITHPRARLSVLRAGPKRRRNEPRDQAGPGSPALVAIGASTGGPGAIVEILRGLPADFQLPILLVLHINEPFGTALADWLDAQTNRRVAFVKDGASLASLAGRVGMAPPGHHMILKGARIHLTQDPERHACRPSVDVLFESIAKECGASAVACLLTGMGKDGAKGLLELRHAGGITIAQDEATSVVYGMPREAACLGAAQQVLRLGEIAPRLAALATAELETQP